MLLQARINIEHLKFGTRFFFIQDSIMSAGSFFFKWQFFIRKSTSFVCIDFKCIEYTYPQVFNKSRQCLGLVELDRPVRRPSGIYYDLDDDEAALYVLNLWDDSLAKYRLY